MTAYKKNQEYFTQAILYETVKRCDFYLIWAV